MDSDSDHFVQQHTAAFHERLAAMAHHHNRALALISAERLRQDLHRPKPPQWQQHMRTATKWLKQQLGSPALQEAGRTDMPEEDEVIVIEATYTVLSPDTQAVHSTAEKEEPTWGN